MAEACEWCRSWHEDGTGIRFPGRIGECRLDPPPPKPPDGWPNVSARQLCEMFEWHADHEPKGFQRRGRS
jgi:hypothetical protein